MSRVLVADDSAVVRLAVVRRLRAAGIEVVERDSCARAAEVDPTSIDCALLDYDLGDGLGTEVAENLRQGKSSLPIAFFTSSTTDASSVAAAFGPVFSKPDGLDAAIEWILSRR